MSKTKILIAGIGGVGGYFGGLLAKEYYEDSLIEICFLARGENLNQIKTNGIVIKENNTQFITRPKVVSSNVNDFGKVDVVLVCTKTYDLDETITQLLPVIKSDTVLIPIQNGVNSKERIAKILPKNIVTDGCAYIVSMIEKPGVIVKKSESHVLSFGIPNSRSKELEAINNILLKAKINSKLSPEIESIIWEKYIFISAIAGATTFFNANIGSVLVDDEKKNLLIQLIDEIKELATKKNIKLKGDLKESILKNLETLPFSSTTSMHRDFIAGKEKTEIESLIRFVIKESEKFEWNAQMFKKVNEGIINRNY